MPTKNIHYSAGITQTATPNIKQSNMQFVLSDGIHDFDDPIDRYCVVIGGEIVNYATHWSTAVNQFKEACRVRREHRRNILN